MSDFSNMKAAQHFSNMMMAELTHTSAFIKMMYDEVPMTKMEKLHWRITHGFWKTPPTMKFVPKAPQKCAESGMKFVYDDGREYRIKKGVIDTLKGKVRITPDKPRWAFPAPEDGEDW